MLASLCQQLACHKFCNENNENGNIVRGAVYEQVILEALQRQKKKRAAITEFIIGEKKVKHKPFYV